MITSDDIKAMVAERDSRIEASLDFRGELIALNLRRGRDTVGAAIRPVAFTMTPSQFRIRYLTPLFDLLNEFDPPAHAPAGWMGR